MAIVGKVSKVSREEMLKEIFSSDCEKEVKSGSGKKIREIDIEAICSDLSGVRREFTIGEIKNAQAAYLSGEKEYILPGNYVWEKYSKELGKKGNGLNLDILSAFRKAVKASCNCERTGNMVEGGWRIKFK